ncbi:teneurin-1-like [Ptychodera flava]|uniref:teneurin-1-like n=1 Tax=Ptychodera flava TaxID=63121 RepID=UPI003969CB32
MSYQDRIPVTCLSSVVWAISDHFNNTVSIERMSDGSPHAIEAANGVRTVLGMNSEGMLDFVSDSDIGNTRFAYQDGGLLRGVTTPQGYQQYLAYDENGRVFAQYDNLGRRELYGNFQGLTSSSRVKYSSMNRKQVIETQTLSGQLKQTYKTSYGVSQEILSNYADGSTVTTSADGTKTLKTKSPHPVWGSQISLAASTVTTLPSGLTKRLEIDHFATQSDPNDPLTVLTIGKHIKVNRETITTSEYSHNDRTSTILLGSDVERRTVYDGDGREVRIQRPSVGLLDIVYEYDPTSDLYSKRAQGNLWQQYTYDIYGNVISEFKSSGLETKYEYIDQKLLSKIILPSGRSYDFRYDDVGNLASIGMPSGSEHFLRTRIRPRERDEIYRAPLSLHSTFMSTYNLDGDLMQTLYPVVGDMSHWYDELQRPTGVSFNDAFLEFVYKDNSERVMRLNRYSKGVLESATTYVYDGFIPVAATLFELAEIVADFKYSYNDAFLVSKLVSVVFGRTFVTDISYDKFGEITKYGPFDAREPSPNVRTLSDSQISCGYTHDQYGRLVETSCTVQGSQKFKYTLQYNNDSLISDRSVEIGDSDSYINNYQYDIDGQLVDVITDGKASEHYVYDVNGNRVQWGGVGAEPTHSAIYDENDRIVQHDLLLYDFSDDGFLQGKGGATFQYNARGELEKAYKPDFYDMTYKYDGLGRRILSLDEVTGESVRYFYGDPNNALRVTHVVRGEEEIVTALYYNQLGHLFAMKTDGVINYVMCDHLGTPLVVLNSIGDVLKVIKRDSYGVVIMDSNPEIFVPLGFAGGIYDDRTKLTRFHYRDYDATIGRWTSRDPSLYSSQQPNLYQYVFNDPINLRDPLGLLCIGFGYYNGWGGGAELCFDHTGWSGCVEGGAGVGGFSHELNSGGPKKGFRAGVFAEGSINIPGVLSHSVGGSYEVIDPIDWDEGKINPCLKTDWDVNYKRSYGPTGVKCGTSGCEVSTALKPPKVDKNPKIGVEGKIGAKVCYGR